MGDPLSGSTLYRTRIELADVDRGCYAGIDISIARHPSETLPRLSARLLAYLLWYQPGLHFGAGLCAGDEPDARCLGDDGAERFWLMVGQPGPERVLAFSRRCERLAVLAWGAEGERWWRRHGGRLEAVERLWLAGLDGALVDGLAARLGRRSAFGVTVNEDRVYLDLSNWHGEGSLVQWRGERRAAVPC